MRHPLCFLKMLWRTLTWGHYVSGCDYVMSEMRTPSNVQILECKRCGDVSVLWCFTKFDKDTGEVE
jgi:hypothetical protein